VSDEEWKKRVERAVEVSTYWFEKFHAANERIKRLEEVGDKLYSAIYCGCLMDGPCKTCSDAADLWDEIKEAKP
jgi:hypothetical protein